MPTRSAYGAGIPLILRSPHKLNGSPFNLMLITGTQGMTRAGCCPSALTKRVQLMLYPLDSLSVIPELVYSVRRTRAAYSGPLFAVRRSSDNAELQIGYTLLGDPDLQTLLRFIGTSSAFITTWFNQGSAGATGNMIQATASNQPRVANAGSLELRNGRLAINNYNAPAGNTIALTSSASYNNGGSTGIVFEQREDVVTAGLLFGSGGTSGGMLALAIPVTGGQSYRFGRGGTSGNINYTEITTYGTSYQVYSDATTSGAGTIARRNGVALTQSGAAQSSNTSSTAQLFTRDGILPFTGSLQEVVYFSSALSTGNRDILTANQMSYFSIV